MTTEKGPLRPRPLSRTIVPSRGTSRAHMVQGAISTTLVNTVITSDVEVREYASWPEWTRS